MLSASARGGGVARQLLGAANDFPRETGAVKIQLSTAHTNTPAQALYESCGYAENKTFKYYSRAIN